MLNIDTCKMQCWKAYDLYYIMVISTILNFNVSRDNIIQFDWSNHVLFLGKVAQTRKSGLDQWSFRNFIIRYILYIYEKWPRLGKVAQTSRVLGILLYVIYYTYIKSGLDQEKGPRLVEFQEFYYMLYTTYINLTW